MTGDLFQTMQPRLTGIAYRMLGTLSEAEDAVQDVYVKWIEHRSKLKNDNPSAWLVKVCTNRCLDILKSAHRKRMSYVGPWLPEPLHTTSEAEAEEATLRSNSLNFAFVTMLERLTPKERAAYLLREVFDYDYGDVAEILAISTANCRQLVSRAKGHIGRDVIRSTTPESTKIELLEAFQHAVSTGNTQHFEQMLSSSIQLHADSGGQVVAARTVLKGISQIATLIRDGLHVAWKNITIETGRVNDEPGLLLWKGEAPFGTVSLDVNEDGQIRQILVMRNPEKLRNLTRSLRVNQKKPSIYPA